MWVAELRFKIIKDTNYQKAETALRSYLERLIFNGQILGREFPTHLLQDEFIARVVMPTQDALNTSWHSKRGLVALEQLAIGGLAYPSIEILGMDLMSNHTDPCHNPSAYVLYCRFAQMNSTLHCAEHLAPIPLYKLPAVQGDDHEALIRWQLQYQALDEIQMQQESVLLGPAERALQNLHSKLNRQGRKFAKLFTSKLEKPVYYALYRGTSSDCSAESRRRCPNCQGEWLRPSPLADLFDFQCDRCLLVSNIAWQCQ